MITDRIAELEQLSKIRGTCGRTRCFRRNYETASTTLYADCAQWEKIARSMAYAIANMEIWVEEDDRIGGRVYYLDADPEKSMEIDQILSLNGAMQAYLEKNPQASELWEHYLISTYGLGHITWFFDRILSLGITGMKARYAEALAHARDEEAEQFYQGVLIMLDAMQTFNDRHVEAYEQLGNHELAERMKKVPRYPAETFREAVQAFYMQHIVVMCENPYGGNGPGRLDYYLWPYLDRDLKAGRCTLEEAKEIIDELFLRINERLWRNDGWVEAIVVGGTNPNGSSAVNPLTYIMIQSIIDLDITHPSIYVRLPENPPEDLVALCAKYMMAGKNRAQILYDPSVINALVQRGTFYRDAVEYACGGCMEVGVQGMTSDFLYAGWQNTAKMLELMITGGICLRTGRKLSCFQADRGLADYEDFESFYEDFIRESDRLVKVLLQEQDFYSEYIQKARPSYLISSMIDDCLERGRNMHAGGARYHDYGVSPVALPNVADGLYAIRTAVFEQKLCTAQELVDAMKADYKGYERLQAQLRALPKYGMDNEQVDALANRVARDFSDMYLSYRTRWGGKGKPVILTFVYSPEAASDLGATPDGRNAGQGVAHGVTPHSSSMKNGITAAINSCGRMPFEKFAGGASSMWDFDSSWATEPIVEAVIKAFIANNGQIFQGNTTSLEELIEARKHPEDYPHLIVRVGGYSARFVTLSNALQEDIINRIRHCG